MEPAAPEDELAWLILSSAAEACSVEALEVEADEAVKSRALPLVTGDMYPGELPILLLKSMKDEFEEEISFNSSDAIPPFSCYTLPAFDHCSLE